MNTIMNFFLKHKIILMTTTAILLPAVIGIFIENKNIIVNDNIGQSFARMGGAMVMIGVLFAIYEALRKETDETIETRKDLREKGQKELDRRKSKLDEAKNVNEQIRRKDDVVVYLTSLKDEMNKMIEIGEEVNIEKYVVKTIGSIAKSLEFMTECNASGSLMRDLENETHILNIKLLHHINKEKKIENKETKKLVIAELVVLLVGTIVWSFGDLIYMALYYFA